MHHLVLRAHTIDHCGEECSDDSTTSSLLCENRTLATLFAWAPGSSDLALPDHVGVVLGTGRFLSLEVQTHYNNPDGVEGVIDDSGVRVYYTEELRPMHMGVMQLGDPAVILEGVALPEGKSSHSFHCPSSCSEEHFEVRHSCSVLLRENLLDCLRLRSKYPKHEQLQGLRLPVVVESSTQSTKATCTQPGKDLHSTTIPLTSQGEPDRFSARTGSAICCVFYT